MDITIQINEAKILELAQTNSLNELPNALFYQAKKEAIDVAVKEIKDKLIEKSYYTDKESLNSEVQKYLFEQIKESIQKLIESKFNERELKSIVERHADKTITDWLENKIYKRLEELKKDIFIASYGEIENERQAMQEQHNEEIKAIVQSV